MCKLLASVSVVVCLFILPVLASAAGLVPCGGPGEPACQTCHVVDLVNGVISWLVMILGSIAAIIIVYAGFRLVTSGGNREAMQKAKSMINNMIIGYVIVLASWLMVDTGLKMLLIDGGTALGVWNQVQCTVQPEVKDPGPWVNKDPIYNPTNDFTENRCDVGPSGGYTQCQKQEEACARSIGQSSIVKISDKEYQVRCLMPVYQNSVDGIGRGGGSCTITSDPNNACHPSKMNCFSDKNLASKICNLESGGGNTNNMSGTDLCQDGKSFSVGLWQINILANKNLIPGCNDNFFTSDNGRDQGSCSVYKTNSNGVKYCQFRSCRITNVGVYNNCVNQAKVPANNTQAACSLMGTQGWGAWRTSYNACR